jgi:hypothetical protein
MDHDDIKYVDFGDDESSDITIRDNQIEIERQLIEKTLHDSLITYIAESFDIEDNTEYITNEMSVMYVCFVFMMTFHYDTIIQNELLMELINSGNKSLFSIAKHQNPDMTYKEATISALALLSCLLVTINKLNGTNITIDTLDQIKLFDDTCDTFKNNTYYTNYVKHIDEFPTCDLSVD